MSVINADADSQLHDLEAEEARIMRELREMDEKANADKEAARVRVQSFKNDPETALCSLLLECEKEVRDAKGYIADEGPPLRILRVRFGETGPKNATFLSRPRGTGVDFTVPVTLKAYTDIIKNPIFLNQIRDKIKANKYLSSEDYLEDMRLLARNTAIFNKGPDLAWVVQHARFLLEAAEEAVQARRRDLYEIEQAIRSKASNKLPANHTTVLSAVGKRKRAAAVAADAANGAARVNLPVGATIEIYWDEYRKWFAATIVKKGPGPSEFDVVYTEDRSEQHIDFSQNPTMKWRMKTTRGVAKGRRVHEIPTSKRRKSSLPSTPQTDAPIVVSGGISTEELDGIKEDFSTRMEDMRSSVVDTLEAHFKQIDQILVRSDILQRVLIAVEDAQTSMEDAVERMESRFNALEDKMLQLAKARKLDLGLEQSPIAPNINQESTPKTLDDDHITEQIGKHNKVVTEQTKKDESAKESVNPDADQEPKSVDLEDPETDERSKDPSSPSGLKEKEPTEKKEPIVLAKEGDTDEVVVIDVDDEPDNQSPSPMEQSPAREAPEAMEQSPAPEATAEVKQSSEHEAAAEVKQSPRPDAPAEVKENTDRDAHVDEGSKEKTKEAAVLEAIPAPSSDVETPKDTRYTSDIAEEVSDEKKPDDEAGATDAAKETEEASKNPEKADARDDESSSDSGSDSSDSDDSDNESHAKENEKSDAEKPEAVKEQIAFVETKTDEKSSGETPADGANSNPPEEGEQSKADAGPPDQDMEKSEIASKERDENTVPSVGGKTIPDRSLSDAESEEDNESEGD